MEFFTSLEGILAAITGVLITAGALFAAAKKLVSGGKDPEPQPPAQQPDPTPDHQQILNLIMELKERVKVLETDMEGKIAVQIDNIEDDVIDIKEKLNKLTDLLIRHFTR